MKQGSFIPIQVDITTYLCDRRADGGVMREDDLGNVSVLLEVEESGLEVCGSLCDALHTNLILGLLDPDRAVQERGHTLLKKCVDCAKGVACV